MTIHDFISKYGLPGYAFILRGIPGAGKSSLVKALADQGQLGLIHCSADMERMVDGVYVYKPEENAEMHGRCMRRYAESARARYAGIDAGVDAIVCDNTNCTTEEVAPYWAIANAYGWKPVIVEVPCDPQVGFARNCHGVPLKTIERMHGNLEKSRKYLQNDRRYRYEVLET